MSNSFVEAREREQDAYGFEDLVDEIVYSHEVGMCKPDPRIYELTCMRLGVGPEEMVFLDDVVIVSMRLVRSVFIQYGTGTTLRRSPRSLRQRIAASIYRRRWVGSAVDGQCGGLGVEGGDDLVGVSGQQGPRRGR